MEINIDTLSGLNAHILGSDTCLVYFYSDLCAPCVSLRPKVRELVAGRFPRMDLVMIHALDNPGFPAAYQVFSFPVLIIFFEGKEFRRFSKYTSLAELQAAIGRLYSIFYDDEGSAIEGGDNSGATEG